jgi:hypothetical protein
MVTRSAIVNAARGWLWHAPYHITVVSTHLGKLGFPAVDAEGADKIGRPRSARRQDRKPGRASEHRTGTDLIAKFPAILGGLGLAALGAKVDNAKTQTPAKPKAK